MRITRREGLFDITDEKPNSTSAIRNFIHDKTSLTESQYLEIESYPSAIELAIILAWQSTSLVPLVQSKLNRIPNKAHIRKQFQKMSKTNVYQLPSLTVFHQLLIKDFKNAFTLSELQDVIDQNDEFNIITGTYRVENGKELIHEDKRFANNPDAEHTLFIISGVSNNPDVIFVVYCTLLELHQKKRKQWQLYRSSYVPDKQINNQSIKRDSDDSINSIDQEIKQDIGVQALQQQYYSVEYCKDCQQPKVIDINNKQCWRCYRKNSKNGVNVILIVFFLFFLGFLIVLNYYHLRGSRSGYYQRQDFVSEVYKSIFLTIHKLGY